MIAAVVFSDGAGTRPGGRLTFFASPKKVSKERRPCSAALPSVGCPAMLATWAPRPTHYATLRSNKGREASSRGSLRSRSQAAVLLGGCTRGPKPGRLAAHRLNEAAPLEAMPKASRVVFPLCSRREAQEPEARAQRASKTCFAPFVRAQRSEASWVRPRASSIAGHPTAGRAAKPGAVSLLTFLGAQESESPAGASPGTVAIGSSPK